MNIWDVEAFLTIVGTHSLAKASELMFLSQSTISRRLMNLEGELGCQLMKRNKGQRSVELTERGEQFVPLAESWLALWHETQRYKSSQTTMHLNIGCTEWFNSYILLPFFREMIGRYEDLSIKVVSGPAYATYALLGEAKIDVGFVCNPQAYKGVDTAPVFRDPLVLVCDRRSEWVSPDPIAPNRLDPTYEVEWNHLPDYRLWHNRWWNPDSVPRVVCDFSVSLCFSFVRNPNFWMLVPISVAEHFVNGDSGLIIQPLTDNAPDFICYRVMPQSVRSARQRGTAIFERHLREFVRALTEEKPYHSLDKSGAPEPETPRPPRQNDSIP